MSSYSTKKRSRAKGNTTKANNAQKKVRNPAQGRKKKAKARQKETINGKDLWDTSNVIKGGNVNRLERVWSKGKDGDDESHFSLKVISIKPRGRTRAISEKKQCKQARTIGN